MQSSGKDKTNIKNIVIIGNGIAGITCAREIRKHSNHHITVISAESEYFFSRTALMYVYMGHMKFEHLYPYENNFWVTNNIKLVKAFVEKIDTSKKQLRFDNGSEIPYDQLVIASGSKPNMFDWQGQHLIGVMGMYSKQDLENLERCTPACKHAVVVGGGLIGIEMAEMLHSRNISVTMLVREHAFWGNVLPDEEAAMINRHILAHGIDLRLNTSLLAINGDKDGRATSVLTENGETINCQVVGLAAGVSPNISFLKDSGINTGKGILVNKFFETNVADVYAIGDCAEQQTPIGLRKPVEAVWYTGKIMGETLAKTLIGNKTAYEPRHWFNSAKFFDIEYQTYGWVWAKPLANEARFHWQCANAEKAVTIAYDKTNRQFLGINCFGIRMRQQFFNEVLNRSLTVDMVIKNLEQANFDPEMYTRYESSIRLAFQQHASQKNLQHE